MKLAAKIFLEDGDRLLLGPGRMALLAATDDLGSLHRAAQAMGMSYRWAWGRLKTAEKELGVPLLTRDTAGRSKVLSQEARELLAWYRNIEAETQKLLREHAHTRPAFLKMEGRQKCP